MTDFDLAKAVFDDLCQRVQAQFPDAVLSKDINGAVRGWCLDVRMSGSLRHVIEYRPQQGFGLSSKGGGYGEGADEVFALDEVDDLILHMVPCHMTRTDAEKRTLALSIIRYLNEVLALDPEAIHQLMETRVPCNQALTDHATTQVGGSADTNLVGPLGILNGLVGVRNDHWGYITGVYDDTTGKLIRFTPTADVPVPA